MASSWIQSRTTNVDAQAVDEDVYDDGISVAAAVKRCQGEPPAGVGDGSACPASPGISTDDEYKTMNVTQSGCYLEGMLNKMRNTKSPTQESIELHPPSKPHKPPTARPARNAKMNDYVQSPVASRVTAPISATATTTATSSSQVNLQGSDLGSTKEEMEDDDEENIYASPDDIVAVKPKLQVQQVGAQHQQLIGGQQAEDGHGQGKQQTPARDVEERSLGGYTSKEACKSEPRCFTMTTVIAVSGLVLGVALLVMVVISFSNQQESDMKREVAERETAELRQRMVELHQEVMDLRKFVGEFMFEVLLQKFRFPKYLSNHIDVFLKYCFSRTNNI